MARNRPNLPGARIRGNAGRFVKDGFGWEWQGLTILAKNINKRGNSLNASRKRAVEKLGKEMEDYAKANAPWRDRTGDARAGLKHLVVHNEGKEESYVYLAHGVEYGPFLENGGFPIIMPTVLEFSGRMFSTVKLMDASTVLSARTVEE